MNFVQLIELKNKLYEDFEIEFSKKTFNSEEEKKTYYFAYIESIETFSFHAMLAILDSENFEKDKAA